MLLSILVSCSDDKEKKTIVCWGDSLTASHTNGTGYKGMVKGWIKGDDSYPGVLQDLLGDAHSVICGYRNDKWLVVSQVSLGCHQYGRIRNTICKLGKGVSGARSYNHGIKIPTLSTLDRLSAEWVEFAIDEQELQKPESMKAARTLAHFHARRAAKVVAIAALGEERLIPKPCKAGTIWVEDEKRLEELTDLFARKIKPSRLHQLYNIVNTMSNLGDFVNSIRLMSIERTTVPNRIE